MYKVRYISFEIEFCQQIYLHLHRRQFEVCGINQGQFQVTQ